MIQLALGAICAAIVAYAAFRAHALSRSGAIAAACIGTATIGAGGWQAALVLFAFFIPATALSRLGKARKRALTDIGKQGARDAYQVLANGGIAAIAIALSPLFGAALIAAFAGAFAAAAADTWGTEIGTLGNAPPRSILTLRKRAPGLSGGITLTGTLATLAGAIVVAATAQLTHLAPFVPIAIAGFLGATIDSLLGASAQSLRYCPNCQRDCETNPHQCGEATTLRRGFGWFENDAVNLAATLCGALTAALTYRIFL